MDKLKLEKYNKLKVSVKKSLKTSDPLASLKLKPISEHGSDHGSDHVSLRIPVGKEHLKLKI